MRDEKRLARMREIEAKAYELLDEKGFGSMSMLDVAKASKASNETLYRWYGDKVGLLGSMVRANADLVSHRIDAARHAALPHDEFLVDVGMSLLAMLLSKPAIALNRAAAADASGELGQIIAQGGRQVIAPLIAEHMEKAAQAGLLGSLKPIVATELYLTLLIGDQQIRRVIGALEEPSAAEIKYRTTYAVRLFQSLCR